MIKISICKGPVCQMSADELEKSFQKALARAGVEDKAEVSYGFCMGECRNGPCVRINGVKYRHVDEDSADELVQSVVLPLIKE